MCLDVLQGVVDVLDGVERRKPISIGPHEIEFPEKERMNVAAEEERGESYLLFTRNVPSVEVVTNGLLLFLAFTVLVG